MLGDWVNYKLRCGGAVANSALLYSSHLSGAKTWQKYPLSVRCKSHARCWGGIQLKLQCPHCQSLLYCQREEIGKPNQCPDCHQQFAISNKVEQQLQQVELAKIAAKEEEEARRKQEQEEARAARQVEQERARSLREKELAIAAEAKRQQARDLELDLEEEYETLADLRVDRIDKELEGNRSYAMLGFLATLHKVIGILFLVGGACWVIFGLLFSLFVAFTSDGGKFASLAIFVSFCLPGMVPMLVSIYWFAVAEAIRLAIDVAVDIHNIRRQTLHAVGTRK